MLVQKFGTYFFCIVQSMMPLITLHHYYHLHEHYMLSHGYDKQAHRRINSQLRQKHHNNAHHLTQSPTQACHTTLTTLKSPSRHDSSNSDNDRQGLTPVLFPPSPPLPHCSCSHGLGTPLTPTAMSGVVTATAVAVVVVGGSSGLVGGSSLSGWPLLT